MTKIINIYGGPCTGKSTICAGLFHHMKCKQHDVELVTEYAKDMVWENRLNIMDEQLYIFAKQHRRISRLKDKIDFVIVDSPLLMCCSYIKDGYYQNLEPLVVEAFNSFDNVNFLLSRGDDEYNEVGRVQTHDEAIAKDEQIVKLLTQYNVQYETIDIKSLTFDKLYSQIIHSID